MMSYSQELLGTLFLVLVTYFVINRYRKLSLLKRNGIPGPKPDFWMGNISHMWRRNVKILNEWFHKFGKIIGTFEGLPQVCVADPELVRRILVKDFKLFSMRKRNFDFGGLFADPEYEVSLISTDITSERWKEQRSLIATAFTASKLKASVPMVNEGIDCLIRNIDKHADLDQDFDIYHYFQMLTMDTIGRSAFGVDLNVQQNPENEFFKATKQVFEHATDTWYMIPTFISFLLPEFFYFWYPIRYGLRVFMEKIGRPQFMTYNTLMCEKIMKERKNDPSKRRDDFLQRMIDASISEDHINSSSQSEANFDDDYDNRKIGTKSGKSSIHLTDQEIASNAVLFFEAGYETTSTFLAFMLHVLVNRQDVQDEIRKEIIDLLIEETDATNKLDYNTLNGLPYLESVMYETLRYFPPVTRFISRQSTVEYKYKDLTIPADVNVEISVPFLHHDPDNWPNPETFDPLRFYGENKIKASSPAFQAFGSGPRVCPGLRFALMESKLAVARLLHGYKLIPGKRTEAFDEIEFDYKVITQTPKKGVFVKAVRLDNLKS